MIRNTAPASTRARTSIRAAIRGQSAHDEGAPGENNQKHPDEHSSPPFGSKWPFLRLRLRLIFWHETFLHERGLDTAPQAFRIELHNNIGFGLHGEHLSEQCRSKSFLFGGSRRRPTSLLPFEVNLPDTIDRLQAPGDFTPPRRTRQGPMFAALIVSSCSAIPSGTARSADSSTSARSARSGLGLLRKRPQFLEHQFPKRRGLPVVLGEQRLGLGERTDPGGEGAVELRIPSQSSVPWPQGGTGPSQGCYEPDDEAL